MAWAGHGGRNTHTSSSNMPTCGNCRQEVDFYEHGGLFYCNECDTQSQVMRVIEKDEEFEAALNFSRSYSTTKARNTKETGEDVDSVQERSWWSCELYQAILKAQVKALVAMAFPAKLDEIVMQLWFRFLSKSGVAFCNPSKVHHVAKHLPDDDIDEDADDEEGGAQKSPSASPSQAKGSETKVRSKDDWLHRREEGNTVHQSRKSKKYSVHLCLWDSVCFMYAGLRLMDEPVLLSDLLRWVRQGHLPLRSTAEVLPDHIGKSMSVLDLDRFCSPLMFMPDVNSVFKLFHQLLVTLDITLRPASQGDMDLTFARMIHSLNLPVELCYNTHRLYLKVQPALDEGSVRCKPLVPECRALAYVIVALKLLLSLNDDAEHAMSSQTRRLQSLFPKEVKLFNWDVWVEAQKMRALQSLSQEGSAQTSSDLTKVRNMQNFVQYFNSFYQVEQVHKYMHITHNNKRGCQERLKEYQRPFRALRRESSSIRGPSPSSLAMAIPLTQLDSNDCGDRGNTASTNWHPRDYLLNEDFSKHTLKHLTNMKELCEEYVISPESVKRVLDRSGSDPFDEPLLKRRSRSSKRKRDSKRKKCKSSNEDLEEPDGGDAPKKRGLRLDSPDVAYVTYPTISTLTSYTDRRLQNQMDCFHASVEWLLDRCIKISEMKSKKYLAFFVHNIEKILFQK